MTPFHTEYAKAFITQTLDPALDAAFWIAEFTVDSVLPWNRDPAERKKKLRELRRTLPGMTEEAYREILDDESVVLEDGYAVWAAACLYDAVLNGSDYSADCDGYAEQYREAAQRLAQNLAKKKLITRRPVYNIPKMVQDAIDALDYVLGVDNESELADEMRKTGAYDAWSAALIELQNRLARHIPD